MLDQSLLKVISLDKPDTEYNYVLCEGSPTVRKIGYYEYSALRSARVDELSNNAPHYLPADYDIRGMSAAQIADAEMKLKLCPYKLFRKISQKGNTIYYDLINVNEVPIIYFMNEKL